MRQLIQEDHEISGALSHDESCIHATFDQIEGISWFEADVEDRVLSGLYLQASKTVVFRTVEH